MLCFCSLKLKFEYQTIHYIYSISPLKLFVFCKISVTICKARRRRIFRGEVIIVKKLMNVSNLNFQILIVLYTPYNFCPVFSFLCGLYGLCSRPQNPKIWKPFKEPKNRFPAWQNRFLGSLNVCKFVPKFPSSCPLQ